MDKNYNYKHSKGFIVFLIFCLIGFISVAYGQTVSSGSVNTPSGFSIDLTTGNLIGYDSSLKTSTGVTSSTGSFSGSFNATDGYTFGYINETIGFANVSLSGFPSGYQNTGAVFVTGFSYGLKYRFPCANSIGGSCDNTSGPQDTLRVEIGYYPYSGSPDFRIHQLGLKNINDGNSAYNPTWQQLSETYTFAGAKPLYQAGAVNMSIVGQDAGFWACLMPDCYGPQVKDAYIRANYSVDPCILNPAYSPSCPGFQNILQGAQSPTFWNSYGIAAALPHIGGGVQLHGFDYGFNWSNFGACYNTFMFWCTDWRTDGGATINFRISDSSNNTLFSQQWYREGNNTGGSWSGRYLFTETKNSLNMGNVQWWTSDVWNHLAVAGWTKPIWTPDPCFDQPLYSKNCSNFDAEIKRLADEQNTLQEKALASTVATITSETKTPTSTITTTVSDANTASPTVTTTTTVTETTTTTTNTPKTSVVTTETRESSTVQPTRVEVIKDNTSFALNLISKNQEKENSIAVQASSQAIKEGEQRGMQSMRQAERLALDIAQKSNQFLIQENNINSGAEFKLTNQNNSITLVSPPPVTSVVSVQVLPNFANPSISPTQQHSSSHIILEVNNQINNFTPSAPSIQTASVSAVAVTPVNIQQQIFQTNTTTPNIELERKIETRENQSNSVNFISDRTNPIADLISDSKPMVPSTQTQTSTQQVKSNVQDNDAAAGVSIASIARTPVGFNSYMVALSDGNFYTPKEIYRNQKTVDNVRALRQLASDRLHQEMVDQQYRR